MTVEMLILQHQQALSELLGSSENDLFSTENLDMRDFTSRPPGETMAQLDSGIDTDHAGFRLEYSPLEKLQLQRIAGALVRTAILMDQKQSGARDSALRQLTTELLFEDG